MEGAGIEIFGGVFGRGRQESRSKPFAKDLSFSAPSIQDVLSKPVFIQHHPKAPTMPGSIEVYVTNDPNNLKRHVFTGYFENELGRKFFRYENLLLSKSGVSILAGASGAQLLSELRVWSP